MKKLKSFLEDWEMSAALGLCFRMSVAGFDVTQLPTSDDRGLVPINRLPLLHEKDLGEDALLLDAKLSFRRYMDSSNAEEDRVRQLSNLFEQPSPEIKSWRRSGLPVGGAYAEAHIQIKTEAHVNSPLVILMNNSIKGDMRLNLHMRQGSSAKILLISQFDMISSQCVNLKMDRDAELELIWLPYQNHERALLALRADLDRNARLKLIQPVLDGSLNSRNLINLKGDRSRVETYVPCMAETGQRQFFETTVIHEGKQTYSRINNHGVLAEKSHIDFYGRQILPADADETDCYQTSRFLVMSDESRAHSHPVLVIDNHEVKAGHAASVARLDPEQLYYLQSRGLTELHAKRLITGAFLSTYLEEIGIEELRRALNEKLTEKVESV